MQPVLTSTQSRAFDKYLIEEIGIPSLVLMENAARGAIEAIKDWLQEDDELEIAILVGPGNNGGDGLAVARLLLELGFSPTVLLVTNPDHLSGDARHQYDLLNRLLAPVSIHCVENAEDIEELAGSADIIIDALLGTGSYGELRGAIKEAVESISYGTRILSLDIPTGLDADQGSASDEATQKIVHADRTVAMGAPKLGFYQGSSKDYTGEIYVARLGAPYSKDIFAGSMGAYLIEKEDIPSRMPGFTPRMSKFTRGHILAICGSRGMTGAAIMSGSAAMKSGCGLVTVALPNSERAIVAQAVPELLTIGVAEQQDGSPSLEAWDELQEHISRADTILIGCGLRPLPGTSELIRKVIAGVDKPMIIDGGALGALAGHLDILKGRNSATVLTPHTGEMARLVKRPWQEVERDRLNVARAIATTYDTVVVMKGAPTYTVDKDGTAYINSTGNPGLATAGSGDVLAGILSTMLVQDSMERAAIQMPVDACYAALVAVYLHGFAGDLAAKEKTEHGMTAMDVIAMLPTTFKAIENT